MWARALAAVASAALLLTLVDLGVGGSDPAYGLVEPDPIGAAAAVLGLMSWIALVCVAPVALAVHYGVRKSRRELGPRVAALGVLVALSWINGSLLLARPLIVGTALVGFAGLTLALLTGMRRPRWRMPSVLVAIGLAIGAGVLSGRAFVGVNPAQHAALAFGAWSVALPAAWVLAARVEREASGQGRRGTLLVLVGTLALALLGARGSSVPDDSDGARYFVRRLAPHSTAMLRSLEPLLDLDGDGVAGGFGGGDCAPLDAETFPGATERAGDGVDQNCMAGDPSAEAVAALGDALTGRDVPPAVAAARIVLVTVDALRHDHELPASLERLGARCRVFSVAYSASPETTYSVHTMMTGRFASQGAFVRLGRWHVPMQDPAARLAQRLQDAGYATAATVFHHRFDPRLGLVQGFEHVWTAPARPEVIFGDAAVVTIDKARTWLSKQPAPSFLWMHLFDPHEPYLAREGDGSPKQRYAAEVRYTDARLAEFLDALPDLDQTAIVLTGDHGEAFGEHGELRHGSSLFDEQVRVPLWVCPPKGQPLPPDPGPVSGVDVAVTLLALAGQGRPEGMGGRSLLAAGPAPVFAETAGAATPMTMLVQWPHKLIHFPRGNLWLLFDLEADPEERDNLAERDPELLAQLQAVLDRWLSWRGPQSPTMRVE